MRRLYVGLLLGAFLAFVGVQSSHAHAGSAAPADSCAVCALAHQAQRHAPAASPAVVSVRSWTPLTAAAESFAGAAPVAASAARAPPFAS